ncbi:MAG: ACT domain-containing protein [Pseudomonadota bacterium]|nr:ACT domain-containing protein [Pseudomonadota bacterium]
MHKTLVLTLSGRDRPGLLEQVAVVVSGHGGSFADSRMVAVGGRIAGLQLVNLPEHGVPALLAGLRELAASLSDFAVDVADGAERVAPGARLTLELIGHDRPGIVREVTEVLARHGVSIEELETRCVPGSFAGGEMFEARARLHLPPGLPGERLRSLLAALAQEMMVDITLEDSHP